MYQNCVDWNYALTFQEKHIFGVTKTKKNSVFCGIFLNMNKKLFELAMIILSAVFSVCFFLCNFL